MCRKIFLIAVFILLFGEAKLLAQRAVEQRIETSVGTIEFVQLGDPSSMPNRWQIVLGNKVLFDVPESYGTLRFEKLFESFAGKEDVLFFSESQGGNACAVDHRALVLRPNKTSFVSEPIYNCADPKFVQEADRIILNFPRTPMMHGTGFVPAETWVYSAGKLQKVPARSRRPSPK